jgi:hypothetical protein
MGEIKNKELKFTLPKDTVVVKFIKRKKGMASNVNEDHVISGGMMSGSKRTFFAPLLRNGAIANVLTNEEKEYLENITGLNLSVYGDFWKEHYVTLYKEDNILNLSNPIDYISYKILLNLKDDVAPKWEDRNKKQTYQFVLTTEGEEIAEKKVGFDKKKEAFKLYGKIEDDKEKLIGVFKLLTNKPISPNSTLEWVQNKVEEFIDVNPSKFVDLMKDSSLETKLLLEEGVEVGVVKKSGNKYSTTDGLDLCEGGEIPTFDNAIRYLDNPKHQDVRALIEAKIANTK